MHCKRLKARAGLLSAGRLVAPYLVEGEDVGLQAQQEGKVGKGVALELRQRLRRNAPAPKRLANPVGQLRARRGGGSKLASAQQLWQEATEGGVPEVPPYWLVAALPVSIAAGRRPVALERDANACRERGGGRRIAQFRLRRRPAGVPLYSRWCPFAAPAG